MTTRKATATADPRGEDNKKSNGNTGSLLISILLSCFDEGLGFFEEGEVFFVVSGLAVFDVGDLAVAHVEDAVGDLGGFGVVGDHEDGLVELAAGLAEHLEDGVGVFGVEIAGGFVGEDDGGAVDEGAGDGYALLLASG